MKFDRIAHCLGVCALAASVATTAAHAQEYPAGAVRVILGTAAGTTTDNTARKVTERLSALLDRPFVVDNRPGGHGIIAMQAVRSSPADGRTLTVASGSALAINPALYQDLPYDSEKDLAPIVLLSKSPLFLAVDPKLPIHNVAEFIAYAKARPGKLNYGSDGAGSTGHIATELLARATGLKMVHVPYKGTAAMLTDMVASHIQLAIVSAASVLPLGRAGKVRLIGVTSAARSPAMPDVPTFMEQGVKDYDISAWSALLGPAGMPADLVNRMNAAVNKVLRDPSMEQLFLVDGGKPQGGSAEDLKNYLHSEIGHWAQAVRISGARVN
ncbi:tripartite tricarboxylate transporter substrate binding protein [Pigmentiphaga soli]|uniref:Tripartite tricarboxylate transporter substrate binding protein n=1 Tax=Pigmentiphaga soli TaxID=1007095 RepID=A0ABP8HEC6_9BURK